MPVYPMSLPVGAHCVSHTQFLIYYVEWADSLTEANRGKHFIGDFLPPDELERFMETYRVREIYS